MSSKRPPRHGGSGKPPHGGDPHATGRSPSRPSGGRSGNASGTASGRPGGKPARSSHTGSDGPPRGDRQGGAGFAPRGNAAPQRPRRGPAPAAAPGPNTLSISTRPPREEGSERAGPRPPRSPALGHEPRHEPRVDSRGGAGQAAPAGTLYIYGLHAVAAALKNPQRRLRRLLLTEEAQAALAEHAPLPWPLPPTRSERSKLDHLLGRDAVHQGVALLADPLPPVMLAHMTERPGPILLLDQITDPRNVGAILRSAAAFGAAGVILQDRHAPEESGAMAKAASGALETVPVIRAVNLARTIVALRAAGFWTVGLAAGGKRFRGSDFAQRRVALVLGAEGEGLRRLTRETCDELAGLAMPGDMESLNVAQAATLALYELGRDA